MKKGRILYLTIIIFTNLFANKSYCQNFDYKENSVYIYNFIKYTNWSQKKSNLQIGIIGNTPVEDELKALIAKKKNSSINYNIKHISILESKECDVVIIAKSASDELKKVDKLTTNLPVLIITEKQNMSHLGACISFFIDEDKDYKTEYQLSIRNCRLRGLVLSEQILNNAVLIR